MTLDELTKLAHSYINDESTQLEFLADCHRNGAFYTLLDRASSAVATRATIARAISDLLAEGDECGWERPTVLTANATYEARVQVPPSWAGEGVSPNDARALARMLLRAADEADASDRSAAQRLREEGV